MGSGDFIESDTEDTRPTEKRSRYTALDLNPWVCTAPGCQQTELWSLYTKCKDCNAVRLTPPLAQQPDTQEPMDREAKSKVLGAKTQKEKPTDKQKEPTLLQ